MSLCSAYTRWAIYFIAVANDFHNNTFQIHTVSLLEKKKKTERTVKGFILYMF